MKSLPQVLSTSILSKLAAPEETHFVRVLLLRVNNTGVFRHRCKRRQYLFEKVGSAGGHVIDIPLSLWMDGMPRSGAYRDNPSICHDLQPTVAAPLVIQIHAYGTAESTEIETEQEGEPTADLTPILSDLLTKLGAPDVMHEAVELLRTGDADAFRAFVDSVEVKQPEGEDKEQEEAEPQPEQSEHAPASDTPPAGDASASSPAPATAKTPSANAIRQKEYRERKKAEKAAADAAKQ